MATTEKRPTEKRSADKRQAEKPQAEKRLTDGQRAYEAKRAAKNNMSLDKWLTSKEREREAAKAVPAAPKPPGKARAFFNRLMERANKPIG